MKTLSDSVARVIRRELADRQEDITDFGVRAGKTKTTGWRQITGASRMSIDDVDAYATALGWQLDRLLDEAKAVRAQAAPIPDEIASMMSPEAKKVERKPGRKARRRRSDPESNAG